MHSRAKRLSVIALTGFVVLLMSATAAQAQRRDRDGRGDRARRGDVVACASQGRRTERCRVPWRDARLLRQESHAACVRGRSWGFERGHIWVSNGCRGQFAEAYGRRHDRRWNRDIRLSCSSHGYKYQMCRVDIGRRGDVILTRQESSTRCIRGRTWGYNRAGIWVDRGCSARFLVHRR